MLWGSVVKDAVDHWRTVARSSLMLLVLLRLCVCVHGSHAVCFMCDDDVSSAMHSCQTSSSSLPIGVAGVYRC